MGDKIKVVCVNDSSVKEVAMGTSLAEISLTLGRQTARPYLAAYVNNRFKELHYKIYTPVTIEFIDISHFEGYRVYQRTISFILQKAVELGVYEVIPVAMRNCVVKLEEKKAAILAPKPPRKPRKTKKQKIADILKKAQKSGMKPDEIAAALGIEMEE